MSLMWYRPVAAGGARCRDGERMAKLHGQASRPAGMSASGAVRRSRSAVRAHRVDAQGPGPSEGSLERHRGPSRHCSPRRAGPACAGSSAVAGRQGGPAGGGRARPPGRPPTGPAARASSPSAASHQLDGDALGAHLRAHAPIARRRRPRRCPAGRAGPSGRAGSRSTSRTLGQPRRAPLHGGDHLRLVARCRRGDDLVDVGLGVELVGATLGSAAASRMVAAAAAATVAVAPGATRMSGAGLEPRCRSHRNGTVAPVPAG